MADIPTSGSEPHGLYEPLELPFQDLTDTNRGPIAFTTASTLIIITSLTVLVKLWTVWATTRKLALNDGIMILALIFGIAYTACICLSVQSGLGVAEDLLDKERVERLSKNYYAANILLVLSLACAKIAVTLLIISIKPLKIVMIASYGVVAFCALWGIASAVTLSLQCSPDRWALGPSDRNTCVEQHTMQIIIRACDIASDLAIVVLPIAMMQAVQTSTLKRTVVILLFALRIVTPILTLVSILTLSDFYSAATSDRPFEAVTPSVYTTIALNLSIITACIPSIKRFLADWASGLSKAEINEGFEMEVSAGKSRSGGETGRTGYGMGSKGSMGGSRSGGIGGRLAPRLWGISGGSGIGKSMVGSMGSQRGREEGDIGLKDLGRSGGGAKGGAREESDSVKGLTDGVIMYTKDYKVEYEDRDAVGGVEGRDGSTNSSARERDGGVIWEGRSL